MFDAMKPANIDKNLELANLNKCGQVNISPFERDPYNCDTGEVEYRIKAGPALHGLFIQQSSLDGKDIYWSCLQQGLPIPGLP